MKTKSHIERYKLILLCLKLLPIGVIVIITAFYLADFNITDLTNSWLHPLLILGFILCAPSFIYGCFTSAIYWRDHMIKTSGNIWLGIMIICSLIEVCGFSLGVISGTIFFLFETLPGYRKLSKIQP